MDRNYERFCKDAKYFPSMNKPYSIWINGKRLSSKDTEDLFSQYLRAIEH